MEPFEAVVSDMDGVLTRTAELHEQAWKETFDAYLHDRTGDRAEPFSGEDYRAHVDGKPRYEGVAAFLESRGIDLPRGDPADDAQQETVCGLGNRKNARFLELLEERGVHVFADARTALSRWRRGDLKLAGISASRNSRRVLEAGGLMPLLDVVVDGQMAAELGLEDKSAILLEASRRLRVEPEKAVVLEDAIAGVRAARAGGFGLVVGVSRNAHDAKLRDAGAHRVLRDLNLLDFPRRIPSALERWEELAQWRHGRELAVFLDFDGTLAPIVDEPAAARLPPATRKVLELLAARCPVAVISGRDRADVESRVGTAGILYAGNHGFDIAGPEGEKILPEAREARGDVERARRDLEARAGDVPGMLIEPKRFSVAVHYRRVRDAADVERIGRFVDEIASVTGLRKRTGKMVLELEPAVDWDKGRALRWLMDVMDVEPSRSFVIYIGDDVTDEDAFSALADDGAGVVVSEPVSGSLADYRLADTEAVREFLENLAEGR